MKQKEILLFGATGQIGRNLIRKLTKNNYKIIAVTRNIHRAGYILKTQANPGYLELVELKNFNIGKLDELMKRCSVCINLIGILFEKKQYSFKTIHTGLPDILSKIANEINVVGLMNTQLAIKEGKVYVLEVNPRASRTVPFVAKATSIPIAKIAAKLAGGYCLDELLNDITKSTPASFEPTIDYVVTKIPRFTFEKFSTSPAILGTSMKSVGEAMAIGRNFKESLQKALVSLETGFSGLDRIFNLNKRQIEKKLKENIPNKILLVAEAMRKKINLKKIYNFYKSSDREIPNFWVVDPMQYFPDQLNIVKKNLTIMQMICTLCLTYLYDSWNI